MARHEKHCTLNPSRACKCCALLDDSRNADFERKTAAELAILLAAPASIAKNYRDHDRTMWHDCDADRSLLWNLGNELDESLAIALPELRKASGDCPVCVFAAIRQSGIPPSMVETFDLKAEMRELFLSIEDEPRQGYDY